MSLYDYAISREIARSDPPFDALIMAAIRKADGGNGARLSAAFPELVAEMRARYNAPGGALPGEHVEYGPIALDDCPSCTSADPTIVVGVDCTDPYHNTAN